MPAEVVSRDAEAAELGDFLASVTAEPAALVIEGEAGIGKTTLWLGAVDGARLRGFRVMATRPAAAESVLAYSALADMLSNVDSSVLSELPTPQRIAVDQVLLRSNGDQPPTDQQAVAAGFLSAVGAQADRTPVLLAVDDLQWLDPSSRLVLAFAARRLVGPVAVLATLRTGDAVGAGNWLELPRPELIRRMALGPLELGALHALISDRLGRSFPRPVMVRIAEISQGNPLYALELARGIDVGASITDMSLPRTLAELVASRLDTADPAAADALLAAACLADPTVDLVARAVNSEPDAIAARLAGFEDGGLIHLTGNHFRFEHPLYSRGVYHLAPRAKRRAMHRRLADLVSEPEVRARHLALGATGADPLTVDALDEAADAAQRRGAPVAAAELLDLAITLGGDLPQRRIRSAKLYFDAGDPGRARKILEELIAGLPPGRQRAEASILLGHVRVLDDSFTDAADLLERALSQTDGDAELLVPTLVMLAFALLNTGRLDEAGRRTEEAVVIAEASGLPRLLSQSLSMRTMVRFLVGEGVDEPSLRRAMDAQEWHDDLPIVLRPSVHCAVLWSLTGRVDEARRTWTALRRDCIERGEEGELTFVAFQGALTAVWSGDIAEATLIVEDAVERAQQLGSDLPMSVALTGRALVAAYAGRAEQVRADARAALEAGRRIGSDRLSEWPVTALGFVEVSLGNYEAALEALAPLLPRLQMMPRATEMIAASYMPDAIEAMVNVNDAASAEPFVAALEENGRRLDRAWMLAVGCRGRAMLSAAGGDVEAAVSAAQQAMVHHDRLQMPFERARTQVVLGQLQRRQRRKDAAATTLHEALRTFEQLGTPLWARRVRAELGRANVGPHTTSILTASQQRVAELAASGLTNRRIAAEMFISPKTVEANLSHIYAKLNIRSRAELGRAMSGRVDPIDR